MICPDIQTDNSNFEHRLKINNLHKIVRELKKRSKKYTKRTHFLSASSSTNCLIFDGKCIIQAWNLLGSSFTINQKNKDRDLFLAIYTVIYSLLEPWMFQRILKTEDPHNMDLDNLLYFKTLLFLSCRETKII